MGGVSRLRVSKTILSRFLILGPFHEHLILQKKKCDVSLSWEKTFNLIKSLSVSSGDDFFGDDFNEEFDKLEKNDNFHDKLEDGFKNWEER